MNLKDQCLNKNLMRTYDTWGGVTVTSYVLKILAHKSALMRLATFSRQTCVNNYFWSE